MKLNLERNPRNPLDVNLQLPSGATLMMTAPRPGQCWLFRVPLSARLSLVAVPKFGGVSICLESAAATLVDMPAEHQAEVIARKLHVSAGPRIPGGTCKQATHMLQAAIKHWRCGGKD